MHLTTVFLALLPLLPTTLAAGSVYVCTEQNFTGTCTTFYPTTCVNLAAPYLLNISSIRPEAGYRCVFFMAANCQASSARARRAYLHPGEGDLSPGYDKKWSSFFCEAV